MYDTSFSETHSQSGQHNVMPFPHALAIRFTGSGSEYFRIWIVNLLLTLVTLGIYLPWAKVRRLKYFHGNTLVGDAPLGFHANPRKMLRGYFLVALLFGLYSVAGRFSPVGGLVALAIVMTVSPALFFASLQFRLANTSWRGLRMRFTGNLGGAYIIFLPALIAIVIAALLLGIPTQKQRSGMSGSLLAISAALMVSALATVAIWILWRIKKYQHNHYALSTLQTQFSASLRQYAGLVLRTIGVALMVAVFLFGLIMSTTLFGFSVTRASATQLKLVDIAPIAIVVLTLLTIRLYFNARLQNLTWNHTGSSVFQFRSALRFRSLLGLTIKNWLLIVLTLGMYWPFAAIATARMRLQAVSLTTQDSPDTLVNHARTAQGEAAGDAAADLFGLDVGL